MKVLNSGRELEGKKIKYCRFTHGVDAENTMIVTEDNEVLMFSCDYDNYTYAIHSSKAIENKMLTYDFIKKELVYSGAITEDEFQNIKAEHEKKLKEKDDRLKKLRYEQYLNLKAEFESDVKSKL